MPIVEAEVYETADQIAKRLHVEPETIYAWCRRKTNPIPCKRVTNKVVLFLFSEIKNWIDTGGTLRAKTAGRRAA